MVHIGICQRHAKACIGLDGDEMGDQRDDLIFHASD